MCAHCINEKHPTPSCSDFILFTAFLSLMCLFTTSSQPHSLMRIAIVASVDQS